MIWLEIMTRKPHYYKKKPFLQGLAAWIMGRMNLRTNRLQITIKMVRFMRKLKKAKHGVMLDYPKDY